MADPRGPPPLDHRWCGNPTCGEQLPPFSAAQLCPGCTKVKKNEQARECKRRKKLIQEAEAKRVKVSPFGWCGDR